MFKSLRLSNFKNFQDAALKLGPLTVLVGTNASGKSNIRDAFRFLHGIGRGYSLAEIIGEKWGQGGELQWDGIRGGTREIVFTGQDSFVLEARFGEFRYDIGVSLGDRKHGPLRISESLAWGEKTVYTSNPKNGVASQSTMPLISEIREDESAAGGKRRSVRFAVEALQSLRFLDVLPSQMRKPSVPGQDVLGDEGENLSSVLYSICQDEKYKQGVLEWIRQLAPLDVVDFDFESGPDGRILLFLIETDGSRTSALSASDGTLRFLAMIAALFGPKASRFYFIEELDNGIHPTRLGLLLELIESRTRETGIQVVATTHSPQLLSYLSDEARENASLVYRREGERDAHIIPILEIPDARRVAEQRSLGRLHESGWLENAVEFMTSGAAAE